MKVLPRIGGSFAPPLSDEKLASYKTMIDALSPSPVKDAMSALARCCEKWWELPDPVGTRSAPHPVGVGTIVQLQAEHAKDLDEHIPWPHELEAIAGVLDAINNETDKPLRDAAFHLLWHVKELDLGREPVTSDKI